MFGLSNEVIEKIINVFRKYPKITEVILYGSRAKGCYKNGSDIDLCLKAEHLTLQDLNKIELALDDLFLPYSFDMTIYDAIDNKELLDHICRIGKLFYQKN